MKMKSNSVKIPPSIAAKINIIAELEGVAMEDWLYDFAREQLGIRWDTERAINDLDDTDVATMDERIKEKIRVATDDKKLDMLWKVFLPVLDAFDLDGWIERLKKIKGENGS